MSETTENTGTTAPDADLRALDRLVGTWTVTGGAEGEVRYEWMQGGYFLLQHVSLTQFGQPILGMEIIGRDRPFGATEPSADIISRYYDSMGATLQYVYAVDGDTLTIWAGERDSPAYFRGTFDTTGDTCVGSWVYPDGGGYESTMTRAG
jgi:hypothetical protein